MDLEFLRRVRKTSIIAGVPLAVVISYYWGPENGAGWALGIVWSLFNLYFLSSVITSVITNEKRDIPKILVALFVKFPVLYVAGFLLLRSGHLSAYGLVAGFTWPFFVIVMKGIGRYYLKLDESRSFFGKHTKSVAADEVAVNSGRKTSQI
jgi:hypothetical protein